MPPQVVVAGVKYMYVSGTGEEVYGKKGNEGVVFCKCARLPWRPNADALALWLRSERARLLRCPRRANNDLPRALPCWCAGNTCLIVGYHNDKIQPGQCRSTVGKLADFLKEQGI